MSVTILLLACVTLQWVAIAVLAWRGGDLLDRVTKLVSRGTLESESK